MESEKQLEQSFTFDYSQIELLDLENEVGLIDEDKSVFEEKELKEDAPDLEKYFNISFDTAFGDLGSINDMQFYTEDFTLPYTYKLAKKKLCKGGKNS